MKYKTSLDHLAKIVTVGVTVIIAAVVAQQIELIKEESVFSSFGVAGVLLLLYILTFLFRPLYYRVTDTQLIIHRPLKDIVVERNTITIIERLDDKAVRKSVRTLGVGGLFGYFGKYANRTNGSMTWYATRRSRAVLVCTADHQKIVVTPDLPDAFMSALHN